MYHSFPKVLSGYKVISLLTQMTAAGLCQTMRINQQSCGQEIQEKIT